MRLEFQEFKAKYFPLAKLNCSNYSQNLYEAKSGNIIKTINFSTHSNWKVWKQNFLLEIEHQIHLNEQFPNHILKIIDWSQSIQNIEVVVYVAYNCDNTAQSLQQYLDRAMISEQQKMAMAQQIIEFSVILEQSEIQHRNIKLKNIILFGNQMYLTDFGSARTHYNAYTKQATFKEERHKQLETIFYNSPEIIEIVNEENLDFQEQEWKALFENDQQKNSVLMRNDNWALSIILLQIINFKTSIPDDLQMFYGYDIAKFDDELKLYQKVPQYKLIAEVIKKMSMGRVSGQECLMYFKQQKNVEVEKKTQKTQKLDISNLDKMQLKRSIKIKTNIDFLYLSNCQIQNLVEVYEEKEKELSKPLNQKAEELQVIKKQKLFEQYEKESSSISLSYNFHSPKGQEKELLKQNNLLQIYDQSSQNFDDFKLEKLKNFQVNEVKNKNSSLLQKLNETNYIHSQKLSKGVLQNQQCYVQQLQSVNEATNFVETNKTLRKSSLNLEAQQQQQLKRVEDSQKFEKQSKLSQSLKKGNQKFEKLENETYQVSDDNQGSTILSRLYFEQKPQLETQNIVDFAQFESQGKMIQLSQVYKEILKFNGNLQSSNINDQLQRSSKTENLAQYTTSKLRDEQQIQKILKEKNEKSQLQIITSNEITEPTQFSVFTQSTQAKSTHEKYQGTISNLSESQAGKNETFQDKQLNSIVQNNFKKKTENFIQLLKQENSTQQSYELNSSQFQEKKLQKLSSEQLEIQNNNTKSQFEESNSKKYNQTQQIQQQQSDQKIVQKLEIITENNQSIVNNPYNQNQQMPISTQIQENSTLVKDKQNNEQLQTSIQTQPQQRLTQINQSISNLNSQQQQLSKLQPLERIIQQQQTNTILEQQINDQNLILISQQQVKQQNQEQQKLVNISEESKIQQQNQMNQSIAQQINGKITLLEQNNDQKQKTNQSSFKSKTLQQQTNETFQKSQQLDRQSFENQTAQQKKMNVNIEQETNSTNQEGNIAAIQNSLPKNHQQNQQIENQILEKKNLHLNPEEQEGVSKSNEKNSQLTDSEKSQQIQQFEHKQRDFYENQVLDINETSIVQLNDLSVVESDEFNQSSERHHQLADQYFTNFQQLRLLSSQQLSQYQEVLKKLSENSNTQTQQYLLEQQQAAEEMKKHKEKLNSTREQDILSFSNDDFQAQKIPQAENYVNLLKHIESKLNQESQLTIIQKEIAKAQEAENLYNFPQLQVQQKGNEFNSPHQNSQIKVTVNKNLFQQLSDKKDKSLSRKKPNDSQPENVILSQSLIQLNNSGYLKNLDSPDRKQSARLINQVRQSSIADEIVPLLMQKFESLHQYQQTKTNQIKSPPNSKVRDYQSIENLCNKLQQFEDFEIWSTNQKIKKFQLFKRTQPAYYEIPNQFKWLCQNGKNRQKIENQLFLYGGHTQEKQPHGLGIMMRKPLGAIYEGVFVEGKFVYGLVLELNATQKLQKYIGYYHIERQVKHGNCKLIWFEEIKNTGRFEIEEEHHGAIIFGHLLGQSKRWNLKENWLYLGEFQQSMKHGYGQVFRADKNGEFVLQFQGKFHNNHFHGMGTYYHNKTLTEIGQYWNGKKVGVHELFKNQILQKQITY